MGRSKLAALARSLTLLASVGAPSFALAADLGLPPPPPPPPAPVPVDVGGGWYLRGDVGVGASELDTVAAYSAVGVNPPFHARNVDLTSQAFAGAGVGYQFNGWFRADVTGEYRGGGRIGFHERLHTTVPGVVGVNAYDGNFSSVVVMANGYFDLGTWCGITPYIGGGVGSAFNTVSGFSDTGHGAFAGGYGAAKSRDTTSLAWALQAGVSYDITPNFKVDVGYRYLNMGTAKTGKVECINNGCATPFTYAMKDIASHDVKIGLRYMLGAAAAPMPAIAPGPISRMY